MNTFCTIITADHLPLALALQDSLRRHGNAELLVLIVDDEQAGKDQPGVLHPADLTDASFYKDIEKKYAHTNKDIFRWALKPVLIGHLLETGYSKVIFTDPDIYFVNNYNFLFEFLDRHSVLLTPHWADLDVIKSEDSVLSVLRNGLFNAGFVAASQQGLAAIRWWAGMCHYKMERRPDLGIYDDQKYLDMLPVQFDNVHIIRQQGCNLASWNIQTCKRGMVDGKLLINEHYEPVFIHFAKDTIVNILNQNDALLRPYLDEYNKLLQANGFDLLKSPGIGNTGRYESIFYRIRHVTRLRTRLKRFFFKLAEKL